RRISKSREQELQSLCEKSLVDLIAETAKNPQVQNGLLGFWTAKALMDLSNTGRLLSALSPAKKALLGGIGKAGKMVTYLLPRMASKPLVAVAGFFGGSYTVLFLTLSQLAYLGISWGREFFTVKVPIINHKNKLEELADEWRANHWDASQICRSHLFFDGWFSGTWKTLSAPFRSDLNAQVCGEELIGKFLDSHYSVLNAWRQQLLQPVTSQVHAWIQHTSQALNTYQAAKMFYRDIITQIQVEREKGFQVPRIADPKNPKIARSDRIGSYELMTNSLPLFRTSPFYGWHINVDVDRIQGIQNNEGSEIKNGIYETELVDPYSDKIMPWNEWTNNSAITKPLQDRWSKFNAIHLPLVLKMLNDLKQTARNPDHVKAITSIAGYLNQDSFSQKVYGLTLLSYYSELERKTLGQCRKAVDPTLTESRKNLCPLTYLQSQFLDPYLYKWDDEAGRFLFRNKQSNQAMGFNSNMGVFPFGMKPLSVGQQYLIEYEERFSRNGVDPDFYKQYQDAMLSDTMAEYFLKQMVCGVKPDIQSRNLQRKKWMTDKRLSSPDFRPPALPLRKSLDLCAGIIPQMINNHGPRVTEGVATALADHGWRTHDDFYHSITDKRGPKYGSYAGIVDLLYNEIDLDKIGDFDSWWEKNIKPQFEIILDEKVKNFEEGVVDTNLKETLEKKKGWWNFVEKGVVESMSDQLNAYFTKLLDPMAEELEMDLRFVEPGTSESQARTQFLQQY
ncbi:MAG: hypothetical protein KDD34_09620, partial [Bdellovibrionales bacterium]|nr:hypothetical protein [Bdellovibrionales bacterium]